MHSRSTYRLCPFNKKNEETAMEVEVLDVEQAPPTTSSFAELSIGSSEKNAGIGSFQMMSLMLTCMLEETVMSGAPVGLEL